MIRRGTAVALLAMAVGAVGATAAGAPRVRLSAKPRVVELGKPARLAGTVPHAARGTVVGLQAQSFPFKAAPRGVAAAKLGRRGKFEWKRRPRLATRYRALIHGSSGARSRVVHVYVEPRVFRRRCNLCGVANAGAGKHTLRYRFSMRYPDRAFHAEAAKRVLFYYGQRDGSGNPPRFLKLVGSAQQRPSKGSATRVSISYPVKLPGVYNFQIAACTKTSERVDGVGLPGAPGSHGCGHKRISLRDSQHWLG